MTGWVIGAAVRRSVNGLGVRTEGGDQFVGVCTLAPRAPRVLD